VVGATVAVTADHGMDDKTARDGTANVIYLEDKLNLRFGAGTVRVICPIADPFVRHHVRSNRSCLRAIPVAA
jgi:phosphonoacetate hydrolase